MTTRPVFIAAFRAGLSNCSTAPNWALDAAQKPGADPYFVTVPPAMGWWFGKPARYAFEGVSSTYRQGVMAAVE
jgi:hypothetical protein